MSYLEFINDYPREREPGWSVECQGITHDDQNWFISQKTRIWKFPIATHDLNEGVSLQYKNPVTPGSDEFYLTTEISAGERSKGIRCTAIPKSLWDRGYNHFGDIDYHKGFILAPLEHKDFDKQPLIVVFDALSLSYCSHAEIRYGIYHSPWCAVNPTDGFLYSSNDNHVRSLTACKFELTATGKFKFSSFGGRTLKGPSGNPPLKINGIQGGAFSSKENLFYLVSNAGIIDGGIYTFETEAKKFNLLGHQQVVYNPSTGTWEELEGITIWDVEGDPKRNAKGLKNIKGQLHMVMLDNDGFTSDDAYIKHFRAPAEAENPVPLDSQQELVAEIAPGQHLEIFAGLARTDFKGFVSKVSGTTDPYISPGYVFDKAGWHQFTFFFEVGRTYEPGEVLGATANLSLAGISNIHEADFAGWSVGNTTASWNPETKRVRVSANFGIRDSDGFINRVAYRVMVRVKLPTKKANINIGAIQQSAGIG